MELRHLRYFAAVAAHGNFSRAAENLHLTQPALSRQVKDLEDELGVPLFVRGQNFVSLTPAGEIFYQEARDLLARADQAVQRVRGEVKQETLRVGYGPSLTAGILPRALEKFQNESPRVRIELEDLAPTEMVDKVKDGRLDVVISPTGLELKLPEYEWTELRQIFMVLVLSPAHPLAKLKRVPPARLKGVPLIGLGRVNFPDYLTKMRAVLKPFGVVPDFFTTVEDGVSPIFTALEAKVGAAILADGIMHTLPRSLEVRPFYPPLPPLLLVAGIPAVRPNPHAAKFVQLLRAEALKLKSA
ncbi:LysR family transcriptional regulator [Oleiharenicola lentus]|uniref:LysR family transcriptional regulator n=1 Tax=Oleiharenicola lentus TaxID=2508720 RepID=UPI003F66F54E